MADIFNMVDTWNDGTTTFTAIKMDVTDTASASGSNLLDLQLGGASNFTVGKDLVEKKRGTNAQSFNIYNTYTDASNYERGVVRWNADTLEIGAEYAGTGVSRSLELFATGNITINASKQTAGGTQSFEVKMNDQTVLNVVDTNRVEIKNTNSFRVSPDDIRFLSLPTSDPLVVNRLWNDAGTLKISAG